MVVRSERLTMLRRILVTATALSLAGTTAMAPPAAANPADPCSEIDWTATWLVQGDPVHILETGQLNLLGNPTQVDLDNLTQVPPAYSDASRSLWFRSLHWLAIAGRKAAREGRTDLLDKALDVAARYHRQSPDPGGADPVAATAAGWDEGAITRREEALNCLYVTAQFTGLAPRDRLEPALVMLAQANLDERRYLGPPRRPPHNHALLANHVLWTTGTILNRPDLENAAVQRLLVAFDKSFSKQGFNIEGSSVYQFLLYPSWLRVAHRMRDTAHTAEADKMDVVIRDVLRTALHMVQPDGKVNILGDGTPDPNGPGLPFDAAAPLVLRDPTAVFAARFSWTDPRTPYVTMRVGRNKGPHGHDDFGSITWYAAGVPIVVDAGFYDYEASEINTWLDSRAAHNLPVNGTAADRSGRSGVTAKLGRSSQNRRTGTVSARILQPGSAKSTISREVTYTKDATLRVSDTGKRLRQQTFTLNPAFDRIRLRKKATRAVVRDSEGRVLRLSVKKGSRIRAVKGRTSPRAGWSATGWQTLTPSPQLVVTGKKELTTTFRVSG